ncbi:MAG: hypothetical protein KDA89_08605 [Planctomycetaceae bacterium]|nr:hypothetical protein [Planctomycetaceae bacterium]
MGDRQDDGGPDFSFLHGEESDAASANDFQFDADAVADNSDELSAENIAPTEAPTDAPDFSGFDVNAREASVPAIAAAGPQENENPPQKAGAAANAEPPVPPVVTPAATPAVKPAAAPDASAAPKTVRKLSKPAAGTTSAAAAPTKTVPKSVDTESSADAAPLAATAERQETIPEDGSPSDSDANDVDGTDRGDSVITADTKRAASGVSQKAFSLVAGYAAAVTLLLGYLLFTGRVSLSGRHPLESLPDLEPLQKGEFRAVPEDAAVAPNHTLKLGESRRFGDVILKPIRVTREPLSFVHMSTGKQDPTASTPPVLRLWFELTNAEDSGTAFPPWDIDLMCSRHPQEGTDEKTRANSWLKVASTGDGTEKRILNYFHSPNSSFDIADQHSRQVLEPGESLTTFVASSPDIAHVTDAGSYRWRLQIRKGVNTSGGHGVTTLVDIVFSPDDVGSAG